MAFVVTALGAPLPAAADTAQPASPAAPGSATATATPAPAPPTPAPPAYPPPPPRYPDEPPFDYPFAPSEAPARPDSVVVAADGVRRPLSFTAAFGPGALFGPGERDLAISYQLFRLGIGLDRNLALLFGFAGTGTNSVNPKTGDDSWLKQDIWSLGLQGHLEQRIYVRGGLGFGFVSEKTDHASFSGGRGIAASVGIGYELMQRRHVALALDLNASYTHYPRESWKTTGLDLAISFF